ncbi:AsnB Asparagine synthase (glutamine-hydrolyzing) [Sphingomonadaceae bacterium]
MASHNARYVISFNGEIYNHSEMKERLEGEKGLIGWNGYSDTEIFLEYIAHFGVAEALSKANGMFAFCLWDRDRQELLMARDRYGQKPLYYYRADDVVLASSDIDTIPLLKKFEKKIKETSFNDYLSYGYISSPSTIYENIFQVEPGYCVVLSVKEKIYFKKNFLFFTHNSAFNVPKSQSQDDEYYISKIDDLLTSAVNSHMIADVPVGVFLSGGIDSGLIAIKAASVKGADLQTFTVAFPGASFDEAPVARQVAAAIGSRHHEIEIDDSSVVATFDQIPDIWTEPFADPSQLAACILSQRARDYVTVALCGDGGDEFFWGYRKYNIAKRILSITKILSPNHRRICASGLDLVGACAAAARFRSAQRQLSTLSNWIDYTNLDALCSNLDRSNGSKVLLTATSGRPDLLSGRCNLSEIPNYDQRYYLPDGLMTKSDRSAMAFSLEVRSPFLDNEVTSFSASLPSRLTFEAPESKKLLRDLGRRLLPSGIAGRPKTGFSVPIRYWITGPLKERSEYYLSPKAIKQIPFIDGARVETLLESWRRGNSALDRLIWNILILSYWNLSRTT